MKDKLVLHGLIGKVNGLYSALCLELDVASQGRTIAEAKKNLQEAVEVYWEDVIETKEAKDFFPRPAPRSEWIKFFKAEAKALGKKFKSPRFYKHHQMPRASGDPKGRPFTLRKKLIRIISTRDMNSKEKEVYRSYEKSDPQIQK